MADGIGVSFISQVLVNDEIERGDLAPFRISGLDQMMRPIYAVQPSLAELTPHAAWFTMLMMDAPTGRQTRRSSWAAGQSAPEPGWDGELGWGGSSPTM